MIDIPLMVTVSLPATVPSEVLAAILVDTAVIRITFLDGQHPCLLLSKLEDLRYIILFPTFAYVFLTLVTVDLSFLNERLQK